MNQVSMSGVNLDDTEARFAGTARGSGKSRNDVLDTIDRERLRHRIALRETQCAGRNDIVPTPVTFRNPSVTSPRCVRAGLAPGMRQLHPSHTALLMNELHDAS